MTQTHKCHDHPPEDHDGGNEDARSETLEQDLRVERIRAIIEQVRMV